MAGAAAAQNTPVGIPGVTAATQPIGAYAPFALAGITRTQGQASRLLESFIKQRASSATNPIWPIHFWADVEHEKRSVGLENQILSLLQANGYIGDKTITAPRSGLETSLRQLSVTGGPAHGSGGFADHLNTITNAFYTDNTSNWTTQLPPDFHRAGCEIYRSMLEEGCKNTRSWVSDNTSDAEKKSSEWTDIWSHATGIDFEVGEGRPVHEVMQQIATSDKAEISLRRLASFIYLRRTGDKVGAEKMLAIKTPGRDRDVAPQWLVDEVSSQTRAEYKLAQTVAGLNRGGGGGPRGRGRGSHQWQDHSGASPQSSGYNGGGSQHRGKGGRHRGRGR